MMDLVLFLFLFYNPGHCKHTETKSKRDRGSGRDQVSQGEVRSLFFLSISKILKYSWFEKSKKGKM